MLASDTEQVLCEADAGPDDTDTRITEPGPPPALHRLTDSHPSFLHPWPGPAPLQIIALPILAKRGGRRITPSNANKHHQFPFSEN